jgi:hypothetical protein
VQRIVPRPQPPHGLELTVVVVLQDLARGAVDEQYLVEPGAAFIVRIDHVRPVGNSRERNAQVVAGHFLLRNLDDPVDGQVFGLGR